MSKRTKFNFSGIELSSANLINKSHMKKNRFFGFLKRKLTPMYFALLLLLISVGPISAQMMEDAASSDVGGAEAAFRYGVLIGGTFNQFTQPGTMIGFNGGAMGRWNAVDFMDLQFELLYTMQGGGREPYTRDLTDLGGELTAVTYNNRSVIFQNLELPVSLRFTLNPIKAGEIVPRLFVGGSIAYNIAAFETHDKYYVLDDGTPVAITNKLENVGNEYEDLMYSIHGGIAMDFKLNGGYIFTTEFRYRQGMNNVNSITDIPQLRGVLFTNTIALNFIFTF
jgi:hypothetical protein